ncbi:MAG: hypothetical protein WCL27_16650, partial [Betaproteobacteria bacterium]
MSTTPRNTPVENGQITETANAAFHNDLIMAFIEAYDVHAITNGMFYYNDPVTSKFMPLKKAGMMLKFRQLNTPKRFQKFIDALQESHRIRDSVYYGSNPPPNSFVINNTETQPTLLDTVLNNLFNMW